MKKTKTRKPRKNEESQICQALYRWFFYQHRKALDSYLRFEVRQTSKIQQAILKSEGNKPGTSDILISAPRHGFSGLWLEVKTKTGRLSDFQIEFQKARERENYFCAVCYGIDHCKSVIDAYMIEDKPITVQLVEKEKPISERKRARHHLSSGQP